MSTWLDQVIEEGGADCGNCGVRRFLHDREIEECPNCGDDVYDIYETDEVFKALPMCETGAES